MYSEAFLGTPELVIIAVIVLLLFGASRIPEIAKSLGEGVKAFRKAVNSKEEEPGKEDDEQEQPPKP